MDSGAQRAANSAAPAAEVSLTEADLLDLAGESELEAVSTLILREQEITSLDPALFGRLSACEILSLSNNAICSLAPCSSMLQLQVLNINFNRISDLRPLAQCVELRQLFASNNKISSITALGRCMRLSSLSLFRNQLSSLDAAINVLRTLSSLTELDLGSNPCALGPPYRHRLVRELNLKTLDGDSLTELDADLAADFFSESPPAPLMPPVESLRPATAACALHSTADFERPGTAVRRMRPDSAPSSPMKLGGSEGAGGSSTTRLFRDPFLDSNPILLQYLAEAEAEKGRAAEASSSDGPLPTQVHTHAALSAHTFRLRRAQVSANAAEAPTGRAGGRTAARRCSACAGHWWSGSATRQPRWTRPPRSLPRSLRRSRCSRRARVTRWRARHQSSKAYGSCFFGCRSSPRSAMGWRA